MPVTSDERLPGAKLRRFARPPTPIKPCELCSAPLAAEHEHLVEVSTRKLLCACEACAILFGYDADIKYRRVPRRARFLKEFRLTDAAWNSLGIPIGLAFLFPSTPAGKMVALYPSPAGATESQLGLDAWEDLVRENPILREMEPDVEALLVNRVDGARDQYLAPIDECYRLVGLIRMHWKGLSGGREVWEHLGRFFADLNRRAR
jgi:hypothetical protein